MKIEELRQRAAIVNVSSIKGDRRPKILDLFCCTGGAGMGYYLSGCDVFGVDIAPQPRYPFIFMLADAVEFVKEHGHEYDGIHASPPCQGYSPLNAYNQLEYPDLVSKIREALIAVGKPWVIENVLQAPLHNPTVLRGDMFGLQLYRPRGFETSFPVTQPVLPPRGPKCVRNGYLPTLERPFMSIHGGKHSRAWQRKACEYMGVPWMIAAPGMYGLRTGIREVCEAIPPAYTKYIGRFLMEAARR
jgi:DNA (cytosine-5)-methyltransferase 1